MMAYFYNPTSYANTFYGTPFSRRRPSPPPMTYYPRNTSYDSYMRALAEEQAAHAELQNAIKREQEARRRRAEEEARARARAKEQARARANAARQRPQTFYGFPSGFGHGYADEDDEGEELFSPFEHFYSAPKRSPCRAFQPQCAPKQARSQSRQRFEPTRDEEAQQQTLQNLTDSSPKVTIPITSSIPAATTAPVTTSLPQYSEKDRNEAASKIQTTYRAYATRKSALAEIESISQRFGTLCTNFSFPSPLDFQHDPASYELAPDEKPKLSFTPRNAPVHAYEDSLLKLLQSLDAVESHGVVHVRDVRRALVKAIEEQLSMVDDEVRRMWEERLAQAKASARELSAEAMDAEPTTTADSVVDEAMSEVASSLPSETIGIEPTMATESVVEQTVPASEPEASLPELAETMVAEPETTAEPFTQGAEVALQPLPTGSMDVEATAPSAGADAPTPTPVLMDFDSTTADEPVIEKPASDFDSEVEMPPSVVLPVSPVIAHTDPTSLEDEEEMVMIDKALEVPASKASETEFVMV